MYIPNEQKVCGTLIGRQGKNIEDLMSKCGVRIDIERPEMVRPGAPDRKVTLSQGTPEGFLRCKQLIEAQIASFQASQARFAQPPAPMPAAAPSGAVGGFGQAAYIPIPERSYSSGSSAGWPRSSSPPRGHDAPPWAHDAPPPPKRAAVDPRLRPPGLAGAIPPPPPPGLSGASSTSAIRGGPPPPFVSPPGRPRPGGPMGGPPALPPLMASGGQSRAEATDLTREDGGGSAAATAAAAAPAVDPAVSMKERADRKATILSVTRTVIKAALDTGRINRKQYKKVAKAVVDVAMQREGSGSKLSDGKLEMIASTYVEKEATASDGGGAGRDAGGSDGKRPRMRDDADEPLKRIKIDQDLVQWKLANWG